MKKVLVTGGAGFLGANLIARLVSDSNFQVFVIEKQGTNIWRLKEVKDKIVIKYADLANKQEVSTMISDIKPDIVLHLASYGVYGAAQTDEEEMKRVNIEATVHLARALQEQGSPELFVFASTSFVYAPQEKAITETDEVKPINEYAATKYQAEQELTAIAKESGMSVVNARLFTPFGPYEDSQRLIPHIVLHALQNTTIDLASPNNVRDFIYVEDVLELFLKMMKSNKKYQGEVFNVGSGVQHTVGQVAETVEKIFGKKLELNYGEKESPYQEPKNFIADITKAKTEFTWEPKYNLEQGITKNLEWFKNNKHLYL